jgi:tetratricopeptide (TPR) repeat protein
LARPDKDVVRRYSIGDLSRVLRVSPWRIRRWADLGLIAPLPGSARRLFDFHQASLAQRLCDLLARGQSLRAIRQSLAQLCRWLPEGSLPLAHVARLERNRLLVRLDKRLIDVAGQQHFDFGDDAEPTLAPCFDCLGDLDQIFEQALDCEDAGELDQAADLYRRAIVLDPLEPVLHFNLGNVLYGMAQLEESAASFQQAIDHDSNYAEAWNNLGNVQAELGRFPVAILAFRRSLALLPGYSLAKDNLSRALHCSPR